MRCEGSTRALRAQDALSKEAAATGAELGLLFCMATLGIDGRLASAEASDGTLESA